jgi:uncharacterized RDD family membrane protein YckC
MKCPKCLYIGFETGDRCKNCGYDFSLLAIADEHPAQDLELRPTRPGAAAPARSSAIDDAWTGPDLDRFRDLPPLDEPAMVLAGPAYTDETAGIDSVAAASPAPAVEPVPAAADTRRAPDARLALDPMPVVAAPAADSPPLPLFAPPDDMEDEPLVTLPAVPRVPLSVRRTPEVPRLRRATPEPAPVAHDVGLEFADEAEAFDVEAPVADPPRAEAATPTGLTVSDAGSLGARFGAALIDHGVLLGIDAVVLYFTLRLTDLDFGDWPLLPLLPLAAFLLSIKVAYFSAFTMAGGQTIGKMALHLRVVSDDGGRLDAGRSFRRALLGLASIVTIGAPFLTALRDPARRGVHDRASGTRVIALSSR